MKTNLEKKLPLGFKKKFLEALRSGKYRQITGDLYRARAKTKEYESGSYCVMGLAYKIAHGKNPNASGGVINENDTCVPKDLLKIQDSMIRKNDKEHVSFNQFADLIEKEL